MIFYSFIIYLYGLLVRIVAAMGNTKAQLWLRGRNQWRHAITQKIRALPPSTRRIWVHTASAGEFEQGLPVIKAIKKQYPDAQIILSFFSPSGYQLQKNCPHAHLICYLPIDTPTNAHDFIQIIQPTMAVFVKYEFWYHYFKKLKTNGVPLIVFAAKFNENQWFFKNIFKKPATKILGLVTYFLVQDIKSLQLLKTKLALHNAEQAADTRFEQVFSNAAVPFENEIINEFTKNKIAIVAGSTWQPDHEILLKTLEKLPQNFVLLLVPHEINAPQIDAIIHKTTLHTTKISALKPNELTLRNQRILIIDAIGILKYAYKYGKYTYIGGGFGTGIHNTLEAAVYGKPVFFGTKNKKFNEAQALKKININAQITHADDLYNAIKKLENDPELYQKIATENKNYITQNLGGTEKVMEIIQKYMR